jgi:hypothetical protein
MRNLFLGWLFIFFIVLPSTAQEVVPREWPKVAPLKKTFNFSDMGNPVVDVPINGATGAPLYRLECRSADSYQGNDFDYSGDFECRLVSATGPDAYRTLLTYEPVQPRDFESRARYLISDIDGKCGDYPEFGHTRTIRLRGMRLRLSLAFTSHPGIFPSDPGRPISAAMRFNVEVKPDPSALSQIAEDVPYMDPAVLEPAPGARTCSSVVPKHVAGEISGDYLRQMRGASPFPPVTPVDVTKDIPAPKAAPSPKQVRPGAPPDAVDDIQMVSGPSRTIFLSVPIHAGNGAPGYILECDHRGREMDATGFRCGLFLEGQRIGQGSGQEINLLADDVDPYTRRSRAQFLPLQLDGKCAAYPEWGATRHFLLRAMRLTLEVTAAQLLPRAKDAGSAATPERGKIRVRVEPEPSASSPISLPPRVLDWASAAGPGTCTQTLVNPLAPTR